MIHRFRAPLTMVWEITDSCNLACLHCRTTCDGPGEVRRNQDVERFVEAYVERQRVFVVNLSGGEPLLHPGVVDLVGRLTRCGAQVGLSTNGLVWSRLASELAAAGLAYVQVSIDGPEPVHRQIRGHPGAYEAAVDAVRSARALGLRAQINTVLTSVCVPHLEALYELAASLDAVWHVRRFIPTGTGLRNPELAPSPHDHARLLRRLLKLQRQGAVDMDIEDPLNVRLRPRDQRPALGCGAGSTQLGISMNGDVYPCIFFRRPIANVLRDDLDAVWCGDALLESIRTRDNPACRDCSLAASCGGCRACAGEPFGDDPLCPGPQQAPQ